MRVSPTGTRSWSPSTVVGGVAIAIVLSILVALQARKAPSERLWGDEGTFVAMASSLVHDGDLIFDEGDLQRLEERQVGPTPAVILQSTERGITYSKPILYPLMAAPLFSLFGEAGMLATNGVLLGLALLLAWLYLQRLGSAPHSFWTLATAVFCSVLLPFLGWMMSDLAQAAMVLAGLSLALRGLPLPVEVQFEEDRHRPILAPAIGGFLLGAAVSMRFSTAALAAAPVLIAVLYRRYRHSMVVAALTLAAFALVSGATQHFLGTANPYKAVRSSFNASTGYPAGVEGDEASERFSTSPATQSASWLPSFEPRRSAYSLVYFFLGRHTGLLAYFPVALVLLFHAARRPNGVVLPLLAAAGVVAAFYLLWMPENYFGGSTFLGNRYFRGLDPGPGILELGPLFGVPHPGPGLLQPKPCSRRTLSPPAVRVDGQEHRRHRVQILEARFRTFRRSLRRDRHSELPPELGDAGCRARGRDFLAGRDSQARGPKQLASGRARSYRLAEERHLPSRRVGRNSARGSGGQPLASLEATWVLVGRRCELQRA